MSRFFIDRTIFAWVIAIVIMIAGVLSIKQLPIAQYPAIAPPSVSISVNYPGASAETVQTTVVQVIEQQLSGLDHLLYFSSESDKDGSMTITLSFEQGTNPDIAQVQVQNKLSLATPLLPQVVQAQGIRVAKATKNFLLFYAFYDETDRLTPNDISDFVASHIQDPVARTAGVGDYLLLGSQYAIRIWLDPAKLDSFGLTASDVTSAIGAQNVQIATGELGGLPAAKGQQLNATIIGPTWLQTPEQFGKILLKVNTNGSRVLVRDVARLELNGESFSFTSHLNGHPAGGIGIKLASGANALDTAAAVEATVKKLEPLFPPGLKVARPYDTTPFVRTSIEEVVKTLGEAVVLVVLVMFVFLQSLRATLIPTIAVPVVLLGTFGILAAFGYSINTLTMFGMVLAIGLLVDDAIVVVENVERVMAEEGLSPRDATRKSMEQITGALVGIALVLSAVFLPMAFLSGSTGVIYRQFSVTIVSAMVLSVLVALILTPALCATILKPPKRGHEEKGGFFGWFNRSFDRANHGYERTVDRVIHRRGLFLLVYVGIIIVMALLFIRIPGGFLPDEDQGIIIGQVTTPPGATDARTADALKQVVDYTLSSEKDNVNSVYSIDGFNFAGRGQNSGAFFISLKPWADRAGKGNRSQAIAKRVMDHFHSFKDAQIFAFTPPAVPELGNAAGFDFELQDNGGLGHEKLMQSLGQVMGEAKKNSKLDAVRPNGLEDEPQYTLVIDWEKANALGVTETDINNSIATGFGSSYVNQFLDRGRVKRVFVQGQTDSRMLPSDFDKWFIRNSSGTMTPASAFITGKWTYGSPKLERYNGSSSAEIVGQPTPGVSSGDAMDEMEKIAAKLPTGIGYDWTGLSYEERRSGSQAPALYAISVVIVFLCLAALYESWSIPAAVMMVVPLGILGAVLATSIRGLDNDVFFQVGLLTTVGLAAKNAILIVEFAKENFEQGMPVIDAALHAATQRLRPILMTSLAFILGVLPLAISTGAGSGGQNAIGTGVIGGMLSATILAIFFVPVFFVSVLLFFKVQPRPTANENSRSRKRVDPS